MCEGKSWEDKEKGWTGERERGREGGKCNCMKYQYTYTHVTSRTPRRRGHATWYISNFKAEAKNSNKHSISYSTKVENITKNSTVLYTAALKDTLGYI